MIELGNTEAELNEAVNKEIINVYTDRIVITVINVNFYNPKNMKRGK